MPKKTVKKLAEMQRRAELEEQEYLADEQWRRKRKLAVKKKAVPEVDRNVFIPQQIMVSSASEVKVGLQILSILFQLQSCHHSVFI